MAGRQEATLDDTALSIHTVAGASLTRLWIARPGDLCSSCLMAAECPDLLVGAGTVLTPVDASNAVERGARCLVSPVMDPEVIRAARALDVVMIPGTFTPSEMLAAHRAGAPLQKLFPAPPDGPDYVRACLGPLPFLRIVPTSGVRLDNALEFLAAGAFALGFVRSLFDTEDVARGAFERVEQRARAIIERVREHGADVRRNQPA
jgi:2-dehydro-3-deoxyphosphogluconate aldolase/(4S)-4-hydroxy-2-oxoglutarate aldolase